MKRWPLVLLLPLVWLALAYTALRYIAAIIGNPAKAWAIAQMADEAANVSLNGVVNVTISARAAHARRRGRRWGCMLCWLLDKVNTGHCERQP